MAAKGPITWRISARAEILLREYMANLSPGAMFKIGLQKVAGKRFTFTTQAVRMPKVIFQSGLKFEYDYIRFFSPFDRAEISSWKFQPGLELSPG